jgi:endo-1,4-beta-xylanase
VEGVLMWGFWDQAHWRPDAAIVQGNNFQLNKAGEAYVRYG